MHYAVVRTNVARFVSSHPKIYNSQSTLISSIKFLVAKAL